MNLRTATILKLLGFCALAFGAISAGNVYWLTRAEDICWKREATEAFQKYGALQTRSDIFKVLAIEKDSGSNPVEVVEKDPNGCSLGSNGQTVLRFSFDDRNQLTKMQVLRKYIANDYEMDLIEERTY